MSFNISFFKNKTVFLTGHTGFKGSWMSKVLSMYGAKVIGYSLEMEEPCLFKSADLNLHESIIGDVRDLNTIKEIVSKYKPDIAIHMAAQPLVRESYINPVNTYSTNVMGTVNFLEACRLCDSVKSIVNITTDKVYLNNEWEWGYRETDSLDGYDPYSNSKSCSELVTSSYKKSFFHDKKVAVSTCRAGNVIGGGDFASDRIIPDCVRAAQKKEDIIVRNPYSTRPYQHVLEPICAYLTVAAMQYEVNDLQGCYNIGPNDEDCVTTGSLVDMFCKSWGEGLKWINLSEQRAPHEANFLKLDCSKAKKVFGWKPIWHIEQAIDKTVEWSKAYISNKNITVAMEKQIHEYLES